jgi:hypothetical protein
MPLPKINGHDMGFLKNINSYNFDESIKYKKEALEREGNIVASDSISKSISWMYSMHFRQVSSTELLSQ